MLSLDLHFTLRWMLTGVTGVIAQTVRGRAAEVYFIRKGNV